MGTRLGCRKAVILSFLIGMVLPVIVFLVALTAIITVLWDAAPIAIKLFLVMAILLVAMPLATLIALDLMDELEKCGYS